MAAVLRWREFAAGRPYHAALVPVIDARLRQSAHSHADFHELVYVTAGEGVQRLGDGFVQHLTVGDLVFVRPQDVHEFLPANSSDFRFVNVAFASERWHAFVDYAAIGAAAGWEIALRPVIAHGAQDAVGAAMRRSLADFQKPPRWVDLIRLWTAVVPALESALEAADERPAWLTTACSAMYAEENLRAGLGRLRAMAAVSEGHLARTMTAYFGCAPVEFVNRVRLDHAANLLATTTDPVAAIADRCGYASHAYFCGRFRDRFGQAPREYRSGARRAVVP